MSGEHRPPDTSKAATVAVVVGTILSAVNQGDVLVVGAGPGTRVRVAVNSLVPFSVARRAPVAMCRARASGSVSMTISELRLRCSGQRSAMSQPGPGRASWTSRQQHLAARPRAAPAGSTHRLPVDAQPVGSEHM
jgi:hypothetical protein